MTCLMASIAQRERPLVMAILNLTPDSFSDGGDLYRGDKIDIDTVLYRAQHLIDEGADLLDIGGESTRPGADKVGLSAELRHAARCCHLNDHIQPELNHYYFHHVGFYQIPWMQFVHKPSVPDQNI